MSEKAFNALNPTLTAVSVNTKSGDILDAALRVCTGRSIRQQSGFELMNWRQLVEAVVTPPHFGDLEPCKAKLKSRWVTASDCLSKEKAPILERDRFTLLRADLDNTALDIDAVADTLLGMGCESYLIHSTASHQRDGNGNRYRIFIPLAEAATYKQWAAVSGFMAEVFRADDCASRPQQVMFLPCRLNGDSYEFRVGEGAPLLLMGSELWSDAELWQAEQESAIENHRQSTSELIQPQRAESLVSGQVSVISAVSGGYTWPELLHHYGYKQQGRAWLAPESKSGAAGAYLLASATDGKVRLFSHHADDPCATGRCLDQFDFLLIREFSGDWQRAVRELAKQFPELDAHNKKLWSQHHRLAAIRELARGIAA